MGSARTHTRGGLRLDRTRLVACAVAVAGALTLTSCVNPFDLLHLLRSQQTPEPAEFSGNDFTTQMPKWQSCGTGMQCARVYAPMDWEQPDGERIELALVKQAALSGEPLGTIFVNPGGPGASGVNYIRDGIDSAVGEDLQHHFDIIGWDPRGVGQSSAVSCLDDREMDEHLFGVDETDGLEPGSEAWVEAALESAKEYGAACLEKTGPLLGYVDTASTVKDLDMLRAIVGDDKLNYLGYSYGTYIGARYADAFPDRVGRLVLDGAIDPTTSEVEVVREQTLGFELALRAYVTDCLTRSDCPVSGSIDEAMAQWNDLIEQVEAAPLTGEDGRIVGSGTLLTAIITPLYSQENWVYLDSLYESTAAGDAEVALILADFYHDRVDGHYETNLSSAFSAINCLDYPRSLPLDLESMRKEVEELTRIAPTIGQFQGYGEVFCAGWPVTGVEERQPVRASGADPILVIGTTGDPATPFTWSEALAKQLESGVLLAYEGEGHTAYGENACVNKIVESYFIRGDTPADGTRCK